MYRVGTVIHLISDDEYHALVNIEPRGRDLIHKRTGLSGIDQHQLTDRLADPDQLAIKVTGRTFFVIDENDIARLMVCVDRYALYSDRV
jgi:hypothetical protein